MHDGGATAIRSGFVSSVYDLRDRRPCKSLRPLLCFSRPMKVPLSREWIFASTAGWRRFNRFAFTETSREAYKEARIRVSRNKVRGQV